MKQFQLIGIDYPSYWTGYHRPCIVVQAENDMSNRMLADAIEQEFNLCYDYFANSDDGYTKDELQLVDDYIAELRREPELRAFQTIDPHATSNSFWVPTQEDDAEPLQLYFSITNPVIVGGIKFLDQ